MIDHIGMPVSNLARSTEFYLKALKPLGISIIMQVSAEQTGEGAAVGFGAAGKPEDFQSGKPSFWIGEGFQPARGQATHVAFTAMNRDEVDDFYRAAMLAGGKDNGPPGLRPHYHANYYAAFVLDPDGNNIEAVCHAPV
jgi:catechol 2,3-dioxygenase-like lactoylglutathione lyase family enzyme